MKKAAILAAVLLLCLSFAAAGYGAGAMYNGYPVVNVTVNGQQIESDVPAISMDGRTMLPVAAIADALGMVAEYDAGTNTVTINRKTEDKLDRREYQIKSNDLTIYSGQDFCYVIDGKFYIPGGVLGEYFASYTGLELTYKIPQVGFVTVTAKEFHGRKCINPEDLGLTVQLENNVLWVNL